ncbi:MAG: hypothetical protein ACLQGV_00765 [Bryobacteraceae bacterium]
MRTRIVAVCAVGCLTVVAGALLGGDAKPHSVTIKGVITNLAEAKELIASDSYLQLVLPSGPGKTFKIHSDDRNRFLVDSNLPKISMPAKGSKGTFSFECKGLEEGEYVVAVQLLLDVGPSSVLGKRGNPLLIRVSKGTGPTIDVGEVTIPVPRR